MGLVYSAPRKCPQILAVSRKGTLMIPDLALIITAYILYRLIETSISAVQRNRTSGIMLGVLAGICAVIVCSLAYDIMKVASHSGSGPSIP